MFTAHELVLCRYTPTPTPMLPAPLPSFSAAVWEHCSPLPRCGGRDRDPTLWDILRLLQRCWAVGHGTQLYKPQGGATTIDPSPPSGGRRAEG